MFRATHLIGFAGADQGAAFANTRSLEFSASSSQYLSRAWGTGPTSTKAWTLSLWYKRNSVSAFQNLLSGGEATSNNDLTIRFTTADAIEVVNLSGGAANLRKITSAAYTDITSWHHLVVAVDMDQGTSANRVRIYHDGTEETSFAVNTVPASGTSLALQSYNTTYNFGRLNYAGSQYYDGAIDEMIFVDGQQLTPSDFATSNRPKAYAGTYGNKGFRLRFENNASTTTLGADDSGNGNNWTLNSMTTANSTTSVP